MQNIFTRSSLSTEKDAQHESSESFYLGQNEDCSPGDNLDSSERLFQRDSGGRSIYKIWVKGLVQRNQTLTLQKVFC